MDLTDVKKIYFVGIGGIAMSAAAGWAKQLGYFVSGSDGNEVYDPARRVLRDLGIKYFQGYDVKHVKDNPADAFILSAGEGPENPEVAYIVEHKLPYFSYSELLCEFTKDLLRIVVTGTHGKSTTAGLLGYCLQNIDDSSFLVGGVVKNYEKNFHVGEGHYTVFEGDEYKSLFDDPTPKFHFYTPDIAILTNLEYDHPDVFASFEELKAEFRHLVADMPQDGLLVFNADDSDLEGIVYGTNVGATSYGIDNKADFQIENIQIKGGRQFFTVTNKVNKPETYSISLPGKINVYNALAVIACLRTLGFGYESVFPLIEGFQGIKRRFEIIGEINDITVIDDYAHHPTAVAQTLVAARQHYPDKRIWVVFEPHTYSRTKVTLGDLANSFSPADKVLISEIYSARENKIQAGINSNDVVKEISKYHSDTRLAKNKTDALNILKAELKAGDVVIIMAVGNFNTLAQDLIGNLKNRGN